MACLVCLHDLSRWRHFCAQRPGNNKKTRRRNELDVTFWVTRVLRGGIEEQQKKFFSENNFCTAETQEFFELVEAADFAKFFFISTASDPTINFGSFGAGIFRIFMPFLRLYLRDYFAAFIAVLFGYIDVFDCPLLTNLVVVLAAKFD